MESVTPFNTERCKKDLSILLEEYVKTLSEKELKSYEIAKDHLGSSFQLEKSVGFLKWLKTNPH
jgi:hypothetical protein